MASSFYFVIVWTAGFNSSASSGRQTRQRVFWSVNSPQAVNHYSYLLKFDALKWGESGDLDRLTLLLKSAVAQQTNKRTICELWHDELAACQCDINGQVILKLHLLEQLARDHGIPDFQMRSQKPIVPEVCLCVRLFFSRKITFWKFLESRVHSKTVDFPLV